MDEKLKSQLETILKNYNLDQMVFAHISDGELLRIENNSEVDYKFLLSPLFGGKEQIRRLFSLLDGQVLPTVWSQGNKDCIIDKTTNGYVFGLCQITSKDFRAQYETTKKVCRLVKNVLEKL